MNEDIQAAEKALQQEADNYKETDVFAWANNLVQYKDFFQPLKKEAALRRVIELGETDLTAKVKLIEDNKQIIAKKLNEFAF